MVSSVIVRPRRFLACYRLRRAELRDGRVVGRFSAVAGRCFATDELNVILADIYGEVGPASDLLGIEILSVRRLSRTTI